MNLFTKIGISIYSNFLIFKNSHSGNSNQETFEYLETQLIQRDNGLLEKLIN